VNVSPFSRSETPPRPCPHEQSLISHDGREVMRKVAVKASAISLTKSVVEGLLGPYDPEFSGPSDCADPLTETDDLESSSVSGVFMYRKPFGGIEVLGGIARSGGPHERLRLYWQNVDG
jgi:hypothetical protein